MARTSPGYRAATPVSAQRSIERLQTTAGILSVESLAGPACAPISECKAAVLDGRILARDYNVSIESAYPSRDDPRIVTIHTSTGGNACCWRTDLVDFTVSSPIVVPEMGDGVNRDGLLLEKVTGLGPIGDQIWTTFSYAYGSGKAISLYRITKNEPSSSPQGEPYADVKVGERVFTIEAPRGLELSLAEGLVSSKRALDGVRLIQTSAPISPGSSGGGLFDAHGHLIGITTFMLKDAQNLNFAIAAEEYAR